MSISESCSCGASFSADRDDELKLLNQWREDHKCPAPQGGDLSYSTATIETAPDHTFPEMHIGFRYNGDDDE